VQAFEQRHFPMDLPDPVEAIKFRMEQQGLQPKDLEPMIGQRNRVYKNTQPQTPADAGDDLALAHRPGHTG
jgi:antitoxin component HigA of HigAB toxin-antitoxin module